MPSAQIQLQDPEGRGQRTRRQHGRAGQPRDPGEGPEGAEDGQGNSCHQPRERTVSKVWHGEMSDSFLVCTYSTFT